jgi:hypothetical protein
LAHHFVGISFLIVILAVSFQQISHRLHYHHTFSSLWLSEVPALIIEQPFICFLFA